jgi:hypothetical protein
MKRSAWIGAGIGLLVTLGSTPVWAGPCSLLPDLSTGPAQVQIGGKTEDLAAAKHLDSCAEVIAKSGNVFVAYKAGGTQMIKSCPLNEACGVDADSKASFLASADRTVQSSGQKLDENFSRLASIPYGKIMDPDKAATFNFAQVGAEVRAFKLADAQNKPLFEDAKGGASLTIPNDKLRPGGKYRWEIITAKGKHAGGFDILEEKKRGEIAKELEQVKQKKSGASSFELKLEELAVLVDYGLRYEVELLRKDMKL